MSKIKFMDNPLLMIIAVGAFSPLQQHHAFQIVQILLNLYFYHPVAAPFFFLKKLKMVKMYLPMLLI